jgi:DNA-binding FrmR family transcriptional regulator
MTTPGKRDLRNRMLSAQGQLRAIAEMIDADAPCAQVLRQTQAVRGAIRAINRMIWRAYLIDADCGLQSPNRQKRERAWKQLRQVIAAR